MESLETDLYHSESVVDLGFQPESLTTKRELFPLCQTDSGCGVNKEAWAALRISINREATPEPFHPRVQARATSQATREERPKGKQASE